MDTNTLILLIVIVGVVGLIIIVRSLRTIPPQRITAIGVVFKYIFTPLTALLILKLIKNLFFN